MPTIRVTCPACRSELEIDSAYEGEEIECGGCLKVFTAKANQPDPEDAERSGGRRRSASDRERSKSARGSRQRDDDDDDFDYSPPPERPSTDTNQLAVASLVLGIASSVIVGLSIVMGILLLPCLCCFPCLVWLPLPFTTLCSVSAIVTGAMSFKYPNGRAMAIIGIVLGILCLVFAVLQLAFGMLPFMMQPPPPPAQ